MELILTLTLDERNAKLIGMVNELRTIEQFAVGQLVEPSGAGIASGLMEAGEQFFVAGVGELIAKFAGDPSRTIELWSFNPDGSLRRTITDPRFIRRIG